jgi:hypothetical protein
LLKVLKEFLDQGHVEVFDPQIRRRASDMLRGEGQQQPKRVAVTRHRVRTQTLLLEQALGKEALDEGWKTGGTHGRSPGQFLPR